MNTDLMDKLRDVGDLNDTWAEPRLAEGRPPLYAVAIDEPPSTRTRRYVIPAAVAATALAAAVAMSLVIDRDEGTNLATDTPVVQPTAEEWKDDWVADFPEHLAGEMRDGTPWSVSIAADSVEVCFEVGTANRCGVPPQLTVIEVAGGHQLAYGLVNQGHMNIETRERVTGPAIRVELEMSDGTSLAAEHVGQRLWVTTLPPGIALRDTTTQHLPDGSWMSGSGLGDVEPTRVDP